MKYLLPGMIELPIQVRVLIFFKKKEEKGIQLKCHLQIIHTVHRSHILLNENLAIKDRMTPYQLLVMEAPKQPPKQYSNHQ